MYTSFRCAEEMGLTIDRLLSESVIELMHIQPPSLPSWRYQARTTHMIQRRTVFCGELEGSLASRLERRLEIVYMLGAGSVEFAVALS